MLYFGVSCLPFVGKSEGVCLDFSFVWINRVISGIFRGANVNCYRVGNTDAAAGSAKKSKNVFTEIAFDRVCGFLVRNRNNQIFDLFLQNFVKAKFLSPVIFFLLLQRYRLPLLGCVYFVADAILNNRYMRPPALIFTYGVEMEC